MIRRLLESLQSVWRWLPIIWKDRQWDHHFLLKILHHKLALMEAFFLSDDRHIADADEVAAEIGAVLRRLDRLLADEYLSKELKPVEQRWGVPEIVFKPYDATDDLTFVPDDLAFVFPKARTQTELERANIEWSSAAKTSDIKRNMDWNFTWLLIKHNGRKWWD